MRLVGCVCGVDILTFTCSSRGREGTGLAFLGKACSRFCFSSRPSFSYTLRMRCGQVYAEGSEKDYFLLPNYNGCFIGRNDHNSVPGNVKTKRTRKEIETQTFQFPFILFLISTSQALGPERGWHPRAGGLRCLPVG